MSTIVTDRYYSYQKQHQKQHQKQQQLESESKSARSNRKRCASLSSSSSLLLVYAFFCWVTQTHSQTAIIRTQTGCSYSILFFQNISFLQVGAYAYAFQLPLHHHHRQRNNYNQQKQQHRIAAIAAVREGLFVQPQKRGSNPLLSSGRSIDTGVGICTTSTSSICSEGRMSNDHKTKITHQAANRSATATFTASSTITTVSTSKSNEHHISATNLKMRSKNSNSNAAGAAPSLNSPPSEIIGPGALLASSSPARSGSSKSSKRRNNNINIKVNNNKSSSSSLPRSLFSYNPLVRKRATALKYTSTMLPMSRNPNDNNNITGDNNNKKIGDTFSSVTSTISTTAKAGPNNTNNDTNDEDPMATTTMAALKSENEALKRTIHQLQYQNDLLKNTTMQMEYNMRTMDSDTNRKSNDNLHQKQQQQKLNTKQIVIEQFEPMVNEYGEIIDGTSWWEDLDNDGGDGRKSQISIGNDGGDSRSSTTTTAVNNVINNDNNSKMVALQKEEQAAIGVEEGQGAGTGSAAGVGLASRGEVSCEEYEDGVCPIEPHLTFQDALRDRAYWLVGLLSLQSMSGFILQRNEDLLQTHPIIVYFLTMLVGAGGNAGNQAAVRVIRGIALGTLNDKTQKQFLAREFKMALALSGVLSVAGFIRAIVFRTPIAETIAVTSALALIVFTSICFGAVLPIILKKIRVDPAHSSTSIQVIMDILGVVLTVIVSTTILDSPLGSMIVEKLTGNSSQ